MPPSGLQPFDLRVCGETAGRPLASSLGFPITPAHGDDGLHGADLVVVPAADVHADYPEVTLSALRAAHEAGATVLSVCSGTFILGAAGLLDGCPCTTHWRHAAELAARYPTAWVDPNVLFVDDGDLVTSAGTAAGIDACLHLVRREIGVAAATAIARRMVVPPQRDGGQRQ